MHCLLIMAAFQLTVRTVVRGYHVYREVWVPTVDEEFDCRQEADNREDMQVCSSRLWRYAEQYTCMYSAWTPSLLNFARILHVLGARQYNHG